MVTTSSSTTTDLPPFTHTGKVGRSIPSTLSGRTDGNEMVEIDEAVFDAANTFKPRPTARRKKGDAMVSNGPTTLQASDVSRQRMAFGTGEADAAISIC